MRRQEVQPRAEIAEHGQISVYASGFQREEEQATETVGHGWRARALSVPVQVLSLPREFTAVTATK